MGNQGIASAVRLTGAVREFREARYLGPVASLRRERCSGSGGVAHGHGHLCPCGQIFAAPAGADGPWPIPEHDGECSW